MQKIPLITIPFELEINNDEVKYLLLIIEANTITEILNNMESDLSRVAFNKLTNQLLLIVDSLTILKSVLKLKSKIEPFANFNLN